MTTTVFSASPALHTRTRLICQLQDLSPEDAIERLEKAGILAIAGPEPSSIVLLGFEYSVSIILRDFRLYGYPRHSGATLKKLAKLAS